MHAPHQCHYEAICHILCDLKGASGQGLSYKHPTSLFVIGFSDAD